MTTLSLEHAIISNVLGSSRAGIRFGSAAVTRSHHMSALDSRGASVPALSETPVNPDNAVSEVDRLPRQRDRRQALADMLAGLTRFLNRDQDISLMRGAFEE